MDDLSDVRDREDMELLRFLHNFWIGKHWWPSRREIADGMGYSSVSVSNYRLDRLKKRGLLYVPRHRSRAMAFTDKGRKALSDYLIEEALEHVGEESYGPAADDQA